MSDQDLEGRVHALETQLDDLRRRLAESELDDWKARIDQLEVQAHLGEMEAEEQLEPLIEQMRNRLLDARAQFDKAEEQFQRLFQWPGLDAAVMREAKNAYTNLVFFRASVDFYEGNYDRCIDQMKRFLEKNPTNEAVPQAQCLLGMALYEGGQVKEGEGILQKLSRNNQAGPFQEQAKRYLEEKKGGKKR